MSEDPEKSRKLILGTSRPGVRVVLVRASDVPTYVEHGGADLGVAGLDVLLEHGDDGLYVPVDLKIARCRMSVATRADFDYAAAVQAGLAHPGRQQVHAAWRASISPTRACTST